MKDWEQFKMVVEASRQPELMLIVDKWKQLQFVSREYLAQYAFKTFLFLLHNTSVSCLSYVVAYCTFAIG